MAIGHELLHYALFGHIPIERHHCFFAEKSYELRIAEFVVDREIGHPVLKTKQKNEDQWKIKECILSGEVEDKAGQR